MKVSYKWLQEMVDISLPPNELADVLTMLGLEVAAVEHIGGIEGGLEGVVVGEVLTAEQHPNADRLRVCTVDIGAEEPLHIVCGAPNVAAGQKVPVATVGTTLHPFEGEPMKIKKGKIRGEVSMGMICAEDELGLGASHAGIMELDSSIAVGEPMIDHVEIEEDYVIEIELTPNRIDGASHYGVARDIAAYFRSELRLPKIDLKPDASAKSNPIPVIVHDKNKCKRYASIYIEGVTVTDSPEWLQKRLIAIGLRPINNIVDVTNYVMMELGQPMHAFDADQLAKGEVNVKTLDQDEDFITLDEQTRKLEAATDLMICDGEKPLCIGGAFGGLNSGVTTATKNVFLECAYFDPSSVRYTAKRLGIHTDSSFRNERGTDPNMIPTSTLRAAELMMQVAGGTASKLQDDVYDAFDPFEVDLSMNHARSLIGKDLPKEEILSILKHLEIKTEEDSDGDTLHLKVPQYRVDVQRPQDVVEEILRVHGYNEIEIPQELNSSLNFSQYRDLFAIRQRYADYLSANGFYEILTNSLVGESQGGADAVKMVNPLSEEQSILRQSMLPGVLGVIQHNQNRQIEDLALYEFGKTYRQKGDSYHETEWLTLTLSGKAHPPHWRDKGRSMNLYGLTRELERLRHWFKLEGILRECEHEDFDYGMEFIHNGKHLIRYGKVKDSLTGPFDLRNEVFYMVINWDLLMGAYHEQDITFAPIPMYPSIRRDFSLLISHGVNFDAVQATIAKANPKLIRSVELHDVYTGKGIAEGKKSYLVSVELRDDRKTLDDSVADKVSKRITSLLEQAFQAEIRGN